MARKEISRRIVFSDDDMKEAALLLLKAKDWPLPSGSEVSFTWKPNNNDGGYIMVWQEIVSE
jgi:hypothetical protein